MQTSPAYIGWGTHDFDDTAVFLMHLPKNPSVYAHEFYVDSVDNESVLHHRMVDTEVGEPAFTHGFVENDGEAVLTLLLKNQSYWLGFTDVEGDGIDGNVTMIDGPPSPNDGLFVQQTVRDPAVRELVKIAKLLYVD